MDVFTATVVSVDGDRAVVSLDLQGEACRGCRLSAMCVKPGGCRLDVGIDPSDDVVAGMSVVVRPKAGLPSRMIAVGLLLPLAVMVVAVMAASSAGWADVWVATVGLVVSLSVYGVLYLLRRRVFSMSDMVCSPLDKQ